MLLIASACSSIGNTTPMSNADGTHSLKTRTGIGDIDHILAIVESGNREQLESLIQYTTAPCTTLDGLGGPPKCREGETDGTPVEALPLIGSEGGFIRKTEIDRWSGLDADALFAVYRAGEEGFEEEYYPRGEYAVVFLASGSETAVTLRIENGMIVRVDYPFYTSLNELRNWVEGDAAEVILMAEVR
jgi:hypothetical protein